MGVKRLLDYHTLCVSAFQLPQKSNMFGHQPHLKTTLNYLLQICVQQSSWMKPETQPFIFIFFINNVPFYSSVVSNISQCQITRNCAIARARSRKVSCADVLFI